MLTPRLENILSHVTAAMVADIGTDHAYIPIELAKRSGQKLVIASDIKQGPLSIAHTHVLKAALSGKIELRLGAGLSVLKPCEVQEIIIAGMGGQMISVILSEGAECAKSAERLILQPMNAQAELREFLFCNGYEILSEDIACEGFKVYNVIMARWTGTTKTPTELELHLPKAVYANPLFPQLIAKKKREFSKIINGQQRSAAPDFDVIKKYEILLKESERIENEIKANY